MKKIFILIVVTLCIGKLCLAQTEKGRWLVSGATDIKLLFGETKPSVNEEMDKTIKSKDYAANAGLGYFPIDNLAVGIGVNYANSYRKQQQYIGTVPGDNTPLYQEYLENAISIIPSLIYFFPVKGNLRPTVSVGVGYTDLKSAGQGDDSYELHYNGLSLNGEAGVSYFLTKSTSIDLGLQYTRIKLNNKDPEERDQLQKFYGIMAGFSFYF